MTWQATPSRHRSNAALYAVTAAVVALAIGLASYWWVAVHNRVARIPGYQLDGQIAVWLHHRGEGASAVPDCRTVDLRAGYTFVCPVAGGDVVGSVEVKILNDQGDVEFRAFPK